AGTYDVHAQGMLGDLRHVVAAKAGATMTEKAMRSMADHLRTEVLLLARGVKPSGRAHETSLGGLIQRPFTSLIVCTHPLHDYGRVLGSVFGLFGVAAGPEVSAMVDAEVKAFDVVLRRGQAAFDTLVRTDGGASSAAPSPLALHRLRSELGVPAEVLRLW